MVNKITIFLLLLTVLIVGYSAMPTGKVKLQNKLNTNNNRVKRETVDKLKALDKNNNKLKGGNYYGSYYNSYYDSYYDSYYYDSYYYDSYYKK